MDKIKILVVGQTPPPFNGQAIMIEQLIKGRYNKIELYHVRMSFSKEMDEIGQIKVSKLFHLFQIIFKVIYYRYRYQINALVYPPAGPNKVPFYRDVIILLCVRPFFNKICFHFHAAGISELYPNLNFVSQFLFRRAYFSADIGVRLSTNSTDDCLKLKAKKEFIIPYGISDMFSGSSTVKKRAEPPKILFVGLLNESKGLLVLIEACKLLKATHTRFFVNVMGKFESPQFEQLVKEKVSIYGLNTMISFLGVRTGEGKFKVYADSDIFCFPSFYEAESFPVVLLEASSFELPIVSTLWRGIPSIVSDGKNGFLVPIKDPFMVAQKLKILLLDEDLRRQMGVAGRSVYKQNYTLEKFYENIETALAS